MLNLEWLKEIEVIKHDFAYEIMNRNGRGYSFDALRAKILFAEKAHKRESKSIRSLLSDRGDRKYLGMMVDESLNYGVHMPTLIKMEEDGEF